MSVYNREKDYLAFLAEKECRVEELAARLFVSEPTVRRDIVSLRERGLVECRRGVVRLCADAPDRRIPLVLRDTTNQEAKLCIAKAAAAHVRDGYTVMLDASSTSYALLSYLGEFKNLFVITSGARAAIALAAMGIRTLCTGGELARESFSFIGPDAEQTLARYNADVAFLSCRGLDAEGNATDSSIMENAIRRIMIRNARQSFLLCDKSKRGKRYLNTLCNVRELDGVIED